MTQARQDLILIYKNERWTDQTHAIDTIAPTDEGTFAVIFNGSATTYTYGAERIRWLTEPQEIDPRPVQLWHLGKELLTYNRILLFKNEQCAYYRVHFDDGRTCVYEQRSLTVLKNSLITPEIRNRFDYLKQLAGVVGPAGQDQTHLGKQYNKLDFIREDSVLAFYLDDDAPPRRHAGKSGLLFPFGCNHSQFSAVYRAFENQVSLIEGPPGTGKTQTILNIVANAIFRGKSVAIISNNNAATENVLEKLQKYQLDFLAAPLGKKENKQAFIDNQTGRYPDLAAFRLSREERETARARAAMESTRLREMLDKQNRLARKREELANLNLEKQHFEKFFPQAAAAPHRKQTPAQTIAEIRALMQALKENGRSFSLFRRLFIWLWQGVGSYAFFRHEPLTIYTGLSRLYYMLRTEELQRDIHALQNDLDQYCFADKLSGLAADSLAAFKADLYERYGCKTERIRFTADDLWKNAEAVLKEYPIVLSTTYSLRQSLSNVFFDYLIIDEASQVDLVAGALALSCARNAVIVGDLKQLPNVVDANTAGITGKIFAKSSLPDGYRYHTNSLLSSICSLFPEIAKTLLREHYRCHPKIIRFCNQRFYNGQLITMTKDRGETDVLGVCKTVPGNHARGHYNQRQIDEIKQTVLPELSKRAIPEEIGIISPYRAQKEALRKEATLNELAIDTVHKFQGREKDAVIITTVDNEITPFTDNPNMLNVAVSRAKKYLRILISDHKNNEYTNFGDLVRYIEYNGGTILQGKVRSVFDLLYKGYEKELRKALARHMPRSEFDSENLVLMLLQKILANNEFSRFGVHIHQPLYTLLKDTLLLDNEERQFVMNDQAHADFLIFHQMDKSPVLVIEVDGFQHHTTNPAQTRRDQLKDQILMKYEIPLLRLRTNESNEEERILAKLRAI